MTPEVMLDIDREIAEHVANDDPVAARALVERLIVEDEARALWGLARALQREEAARRRLANEAAAIMAEYARAQVALGDRIESLTGYIETIAQARRARGEGNSVSLPGIGTWSTRKVPSGWDVNWSAAAEATYINFLHTNYEAEAREIVANRPTVLHGQMSKWLDSLDDETIVPVIEGLGEYIQARPERISVSFRPEPTTREGTRDDDRAPREP